MLLKKLAKYFFQAVLVQSLVLISLYFVIFEDETSLQIWMKHLNQASLISLLSLFGFSTWYLLAGREKFHILNILLSTVTLAFLVVMSSLVINPWDVEPIFLLILALCISSIEFSSTVIRKRSQPFRASTVGLFVLLSVAALLIIGDGNVVDKIEYYIFGGVIVFILINIDILSTSSSTSSLVDLGFRADRLKVYGLQILNLVGQRLDILLAITILDASQLRDVAILKFFSTGILLYSSSLSFNFLDKFKRNFGVPDVADIRFINMVTVAFFIVYQSAAIILLLLYTPTVSFFLFAFYIQVHSLVIFLVKYNVIITAKKRFDILSIRILFQVIVVILLGLVFGWTEMLILLAYPLTHLLSYVMLYVASGGVVIKFGRVGR